MFAHERHRQINAFLAKRGRCGVGELQEALGVSSATLRRDLAEMEGRGEIVRVHGGVLHPGAVRGESSFDRKSGESRAAKEAIAARVAGMIPDGATVFVDSGTTCLACARVLILRSSVRLVTNSAPLLEVAVRAGAAVVVVGGELRPISGALVGGGALGALDRMRWDFCLIGASALEGGGLFTTELSEAAVKELALRRAARRLVVCDAAKWEASAVVRFAEWGAVHSLVTDLAPPRAVRARLARAGVGVVISKKTKL